MTPLGHHDVAVCPCSLPNITGVPADKLAYREDLGGSLGDEELEESPEAQTEKIRLLRRLVRLHPDYYVSLAQRKWPKLFTMPQGGCSLR